MARPACHGGLPWSRPHGIAVPMAPGVGARSRLRIVGWLSAAAAREQPEHELGRTRVVDVLRVMDVARNAVALGALDRSVRRGWVEVQGVGADAGVAGVARLHEIERRSGAPEEVARTVWIAVTRRAAAVGSGVHLAPLLEASGASEPAAGSGQCYGQEKRPVPGGSQRATHGNSGTSVPLPCGRSAILRDEGSRRSPPPCGTRCSWWPDPGRGIRRRQRCPGGRPAHAGLRRWGSFPPIPEDVGSGHLRLAPRSPLVPRGRHRRWLERGT